MAELEWFPNLSAVPGVEWHPLVEVAVEPRWSTARLDLVESATQ